MSKALNFNLFRSQLRKEALETCNNKYASTKWTPEHVLIVFSESTSDHNQKPQKNKIDINSFFLPRPELPLRFPRGIKWVCRTNLSASCTTNDLNCIKNYPYNWNINQRGNFRKWNIRSKKAHLNWVSELSGMEIGEEEELAIFTIANKTMTVKKQIQSQNAEQQKINCRYFKKVGHVPKECRTRFRKEQNLHGEKQSI